MDPQNLVSDEDKPTKRQRDKILQERLIHYNESVMIRNKLEHRWSQNQKLLKGIPLHHERTNSSVRKRPKIRFRKVWSAAVRILASLFQAFLLDKNKFRIKGFDESTDFQQAKVLEKMTTFRLNWLYRRRDAFTKLIWSFMDAISPGLSIVKVHWKFNEEQGVDEPALTPYPLEQVALDWSAPVRDEMRYAYLDSFLTKDQLGEMAYDNIDKAIAIDVPQHILRDIRWHETGDPLKGRERGSSSDYNNGTVGLNFPDPGTAEAGDTTKQTVTQRFRATECFYKEDGKIWFGVFNREGGIWLKEPTVSPYGTIYPIAIGSLLLEPHKLVPESIVEPLEGPQEDLNMTLNLRKDNQLLSMQGGWSIDRLAGVDVQALSNLRPGFIVRRNPGQGAIEPIKLPDVTQTSYIEAGADQSMIEEMMGIPPVKQGTSTSSKTGVTALNLQEANTKENLFIATIGETLFRQIIYLLAYEIQLFETDERIFRVANENARKEVNDAKLDNIYDVEFDMDVEIEVGLNEVSRSIEIQRKLLFIDRALQANQSTILMLRSGIQMPNPQAVDTAEMLNDTAKDFGIDNLKKYLVPLTPPQPQQPQQGGGAPAQQAEGQMAPQPNQSDLTSQDEFQQFLSSTLRQGTQ
jgi:hypothetical protein